MKALALLAACAFVTANSDPWPEDGFTFSPMPRWHVDVGDEPDYRAVCIAVEAECGQVPEGGVTLDFAYDELYNTRGNLIGLRVTESTGCRAWDESLLLGKRGFILGFRKEGQPDLKDVYVEYKDEVESENIRMVKPKTSTVGLKCPAS